MPRLSRVINEPLPIKEVEPTAELVLVTPELAQEWLGKNKVNRNLRGKKVDEFARDMENGKWRITGEAIKFDRRGNLYDGQHRCWAVVEAECSVQMFVVTGLEDDVQGVMDSGTSRTAADNIAMHGVKRSHLVASVARRRISMTGFGGVTNSEVYEFVADNLVDIEEAAIIASRHANHCDIIPSTVALAAWAIADVHGWFIADEFFTAAAEKVGLSAGDPVLAMTAFFTAQRIARKKMDLQTQMSVILRAFNARRAGKSMKVIRVVSPSGEMVPIPKVVA